MDQHPWQLTGKLTRTVTLFLPNIYLSLSFQRQVIDLAPEMLNPDTEQNGPNALLEAQAKGRGSTGKKQFILTWKFREDFTEGAFELSFAGSVGQRFQVQQITRTVSDEKSGMNQKTECLFVGSGKPPTLLVGEQCD